MQVTRQYLLQSLNKVENLKKLKYGILGGGYSNERNISLKSAEAVNNALNEEGYKSKILDVDNKKKLFSKDSYKNFDFIFVLIHGLGGEDGELQNFFEEIRLSYSGSSSKACKKSFDKKTAKTFLSKNILTPEQFLWNSFEEKIEFNTHQVKRLVVKPTKEGSSLGVSIIENKPDLIKMAIEKASKYGEFMIEEFIEGSEITVARVGNENFPPVQIIPENQFYDFQAKYNSFNTKYVKADYSRERQSELDQLITQINIDFNCKAWSRVDLIDDGENFYFLELNTVPGMTNSSLVPKAAKFAGIDFNELVIQIIKSSLD